MNNLRTPPPHETNLTLGRPSSLTEGQEADYSLQLDLPDIVVGQLG